jgi:hypothetical protein
MPPNTSPRAESDPGELEVVASRIFALLSNLHPNELPAVDAVVWTPSDLEALAAAAERTSAPAVEQAAWATRALHGISAIIVQISSTRGLRPRTVDANDDEPGAKRVYADVKRRRDDDAFADYEERRGEAAAALRALLAM